MKVSLLGFTEFSKESDLVSDFVRKCGYEVVDNEAAADTLLIPHHMFDQFELKKPWIAIWIIGSSALGMEMRKLKNEPIEIILMQAWQSNKAFLKRALEHARMRIH
jgi:hypothetical protein